VYGNYKEQKYRSIGKGYTLETDTNTGYIKPHVKYNYFSDAYMIIGMDFYKGKTETEGTYGSGGYEKDSTGIFGINKFTTNNWEFTQGYRRQFIEYNDIENGNKIGKFNEDAIDLSANYKFNDSSSVYLSYATAFRTPNTDELGVWDSSYGLEPQTSTTFELGGKTLYNNTFISGAIYKTLTKNEIIFDDRVLSFGANRNLKGENSRIGAEIFLEHYFTKITLRESFSYIKTEIKDGLYSGKKVPGVPRYLFNLGLTYDINAQLKFNTDLNYKGNSYSSADFKNEAGKNSEYLTLDINLQYAINQALSIYGGINNLTDKKYSEYTVLSYGENNFYPANGRNYYLGMKYNF
ncbi:MAG: TonB-dependent receptor domain-containing protein, partial [Fusobacteriaceae bacterium]